jgi:hypothetical protein
MNGKTVAVKCASVRPRQNIECSLSVPGEMEIGQNVAVGMAAGKEQCPA